jgi:hypothetical protein
VLENNIRLRWFFDKKKHASCRKILSSSRILEDALLNMEGFEMYIVK